MEVILIFLAFLGFAYAIASVGMKVSEEKSFETFCEKHPECFVRGQVSCPKCGGRGIYMKQIGASFLGVKHAHTCRACGAVLYESSTVETNRNR